MALPPEPSDPPRRFVDLGPGRAAYTDEGRGRPVVAIHGLPGSARDFRWLGAASSARLRLVRVDLPGFGETPVAAGPDPTPDGRARFVLALIEALGLERPILLGHSMGGVTACAAAHVAPERLSGLALLAIPGLRPHRMLRAVPFRWIERLLDLPGMPILMTPIHRLAFAAAGFRGYPDAELRRTLRLVAHTSIERHAERVASMRVPTLVAWTRDDPVLASRLAEELADACPPGPRLEFETGGHNLQKTRSVELARALVDWELGQG